MLLLSVIVAGLAAAPVRRSMSTSSAGVQTDTKIAVFADPVTGQNAGAHFQPGDTFEVHSATDDKVVFTGKPRPWQDGAVSKLAGDRVWHALTSSRVTAREPITSWTRLRRARSYKFKIADDVYSLGARRCHRMFYYFQRNGIPITAKYGGD